MVKRPAPVETGSDDRPLALRTVDRALAPRYSAYVDEVQRLIRAGLAVMQRDEDDNPRVSEIVEEAGLSNQAFYRHFRSKDELLLAIVDDGQRYLVGYLEHRMDKEASGLAKVAQFVEGVMSQAVNAKAASATRGVARNRDRLRELFPEESHRLEALIEAPLEAALALAAEQGEVPPGDHQRDARAIFRLVVSTMEGHLFDRRAPSPEDVRHLVRFVCAAVGGTPPRPGRVKR
jgi:AcrR family transcriptional regulator